MHIKDLTLDWTASRRRLAGRTLIGLAALALLAGCAFDVGSRARHGTLDGADGDALSLRFIGEQRIAWKQEFQRTTVGGLSGLDYDRRSGNWVLESDDRSAINPARFYTAQLRYDEGGFDAVHLLGVHFFKQADGSTYPNVDSYASAGGEVPDIESIRIDPQDGSIWYSSEGDRKLGLDPFVRHASADGSYLATLPLPAMFKVPPLLVSRGVTRAAPARATTSCQSGVRDNLAFEGLSFAPDGHSMWVSVEAPLCQDGPPASTKAGAPARITRFDRKGAMLAQYAYPLEPVAAAPGPGKFAENGISEILAINDEQLFVLERAGVQAADGQFNDYVRLYQMDVRGATDVSQIAALGQASYRPTQKRLVLDLNTLGLPRIDNLEGMSWGPKLANGHDTLVLMSDDNFNRSEVTQFLLFEVVPRYGHLRWWNPFAWDLGK